MFSSRRHGGGSSGSANQWLLLAGAGLVILAFVARMLLDIGHTKVSDLTGAMIPAGSPHGDSAAATIAAPATDSMLARDTVGAMTATLRDTSPTPTRPAAPAAVTNPKPAPVTPAKTPAAPVVSGTYSVQLGAFGTQSNADKLVARATDAGFTAQVVPLSHGTSTLYAVRVRGLASDAAARAAADSMSRQLGVNAVVVAPGR
jgi:cell division septation protein DedD